MQKGHVLSRDQTIHELSEAILQKDELLRARERELQDLRDQILVLEATFNLARRAQSQLIKEKDQELREAQLRFDVAVTELLSKQEEKDAELWRSRTKIES
ncbi:uncharacterized protein LY89DRAFT_114505 [Mollisia scopiformis]|uniref:Uncharacterized protein n=1 Tax=Mollisia scopiformis TaxID=149040 RepID=A0A194X6Q2_MOLSC|nr:uncharacterized protein LY89DRAFT_114505 [Mollisia scopiformis]KUJ15482.1 hypothetical protein LY89DRAFT_114505 [Mollisia scopiformis]